MNRRSILLGGTAFLAANLALPKDAQAFWTLLLRHMGRFRLAGGRLSRRRGQERSTSFSDSVNRRLIREIGEIVVDNINTSLPSPLNSQIYSVGGGSGNFLYCAKFPNLSNNYSNRLVRMEVFELQMLSALWNKLSARRTQSAAELLSCIHPIAPIQDGQYDEWFNHYPDGPLIYRTVCGTVQMKILGKEGKVIINESDAIPIHFSGFNTRTGVRS